MPRSFASPRWLALALYLALALGSTWPLARDLGEVVPAGQETAATVPLASSWALWWGADRTAAGFADYWQAPIMQPAADTFALSEPMPLLGAAAAPVLWAGGSLALAHGLVLLLCLVLNGAAVDRLARRLGAGDAGAITAGAIGVLLPYVHLQLGVLTLVPVFALAWSLHAAIALAEDPRWWRGLALGGSLAAAYLMNGQHALFLILCAAPAGLWLWERGARRRIALAALPAVAVFAAVVGPVALHQREVARDYTLRRGDRTVERGAASLRAWARAPAPALVPLPPVWHQQHKTALFPGVWKLLCALAGMVLLWRAGARAHRFVITVAALALLASMLPRISVGWFDPWGWLRAVVPGLDQIRSVHRFGVLVHLAVAVFAGLLVHHLASGWAGSGDRRRRVTALAAVALACVVELWPRGGWLAGPPSPRDYRAVLAWIDEHTGTDDLLVHLPFPDSGTVEAHAPEARAMYLQTYHRRPIANGYSSYWPASYRELRRGYIALVDDGTAERFRRAGVRFAIVHDEAMHAREHRIPASAGWTVRFTDPTTAITIYELAR